MCALEVYIGINTEHLNEVFEGMFGQSLAKTGTVKIGVIEEFHLHTVSPVPLFSPYM